MTRRPTIWYRNRNSSVGELTLNKRASSSDYEREVLVIQMLQYCLLPHFTQCQKVKKKRHDLRTKYRKKIVSNPSPFLEPAAQNRRFELLKTSCMVSLGALSPFSLSDSIQWFWCLRAVSHTLRGNCRRIRAEVYSSRNLRSWWC